MDEKTQIFYGVAGCCIGIAIGFAIGFPIIFELPYEKRGYIGVPFILILTLAMCVLGGFIGVKKAKAKEEIQKEEDNY